jgi:hypothetical protein
LWVLAVWTYLLTREKSISLSGTPAREKTLLWTFQVDDVQVLGSKLLKNKNSLFFVILFYRKAGNLLIWQIRSKQLNSGRNKWDTPHNLIEIEAIPTKS